MLRIDSFMHRDELAALLTRWMVDRPQAGDVRRLKEIVNFNLYAARIWIDILARNLLRDLHHQKPRWLIAHSKGVFKDFAVDHLTYSSPRIEQMIAHYRRFPEDYYRESPIDGGLYTISSQQSDLLAACMRVKRFRRIAEKGGRYMVDYLLQKIRAGAEDLADKRAREQGTSREMLSSTPQQMAEEFAHAERRLIKSIREGSITQDLPVLGIPDVVGLKIILENQRYPELLDLLKTNNCRIEETEFHSGQYNAINLRVRYQLPRQTLLDRPPSGSYLRLLQHRGFDPELVVKTYQTFIRDAEDSIQVEIIVSSFEEYLESEIGRGMHEERVLKQRRHPEYNGHLSANIRYWMEYVLSLCRARTMADLSELPIKLWGRYMPDTIEQLVRRLHMSDEQFFDTVPELPK